MRRPMVSRLICGVVVVGGAIAARPGTHAHAVARRRWAHVRRWLRDVDGRLQGFAYHLGRRRPDPDVDDLVLADRIRSTLGPVERALDLPHLHVLVEDHVALLHGEVGSNDDADRLVRAVAEVSGVAGVESYLHVGLIDGDTRPSAGRAAHQPSEARRLLLAAAIDAGAEPVSATAVVRAVLATFAERLPAGERAHVAAHLPADARVLLVPPRRFCGRARLKTVHELVARIMSSIDDLPTARAENITAAIVSCLRSLVPEEVADVGAVLPPELRVLWCGPATRQTESADSDDAPRGVSHGGPQALRR